jgi:hypothetical protein
MILTAMMWSVRFHLSQAAADIPVTWCSNRYGMRTRTTGECICKQGCAGPACHREQGLVFFSYKDCPSCECTPKSSGATDNGGAAAGGSSDSSSSAQGSAVEEDDAPVVHRGKPRSREQRYYSGDDPSEPDGDSFYEWMMDNWRGIMAGFTALGLITMVIPLMYLGMGSSTLHSKPVSGHGGPSDASGVTDNKAVSAEDTAKTNSSTTDKSASRKAAKASGSSDKSL